MKSSIEKDIEILDEMILNCKYKHNRYDEYAYKKARVLKKCKIALIKDQIEELDIEIGECEYANDDDEEYKKAVEKDKKFLLNQKRILNELLESEENK